MRAKRLVAARLIVPGVVVEIAERGRQAVAAMLSRGPAERPERILQALRQRHKALAAEHDMRMFPARKGQPEMIEPVVESPAGDTAARSADGGKMLQTQRAPRHGLAD